jgi:tetratricopeptide (TPR) repeat protein
MQRRTGKIRWSRQAAPPALVWLAIVWSCGPALRPAVCQSAARPLDVPAELEKAGRALERGQLDLAQQIYRALIASDPGLADAYRGLAHILVAQGRRSEAASVLLEAGRGLLEAQDPAAGKAFLREAVEMDRSSAAAHLALGHAYLAGMEFPQAVSHLQRAMELGGQVDAAERIYHETLDHDPGSALAQRSLGKLLLWQGRYTEALPLLRRATAQNPLSAELLIDLASALAGAGRVEEALKTYQRITELAPDLSGPRYGYALLLARNHQKEESARQLAVFQRLQAQEYEQTRRRLLLNAQLSFGWNLLQEGKAAAAVEYFGSLERSADQLTGLAAALAAAGNHQGAVSALESALLLSPGDQNIKLRLLEERLATERRP